MVRKTICDGLRRHSPSAAIASRGRRGLVSLLLLSAAWCAWPCAVHAEDSRNTASPSAEVVDAVLTEAGLLNLPPAVSGAAGEENPVSQRGDNRDEIAPETGLASWYGSKFHRRKTASGERFDMYAMTAAHPTLAFGTLICVRSQITGRGVVVRVNDRGPHVQGRIVDLSQAAAIALGLHGLGLKPVALFPLENGESTCPPE